VAQELCPDANFLLRPMCVHLECQKAHNAKLPVCIEDRRRYPTGPGSAGP
jgi:non-specific serine/threonine protein kinase